MRVIMLAVVGLALAGCQSDKAASIRGACDAFVAPATPIKGATRADQRWVDGQIESGVSACGWPRPKSVKATS